MAEGLLKHIYGEKYEVFSAGSKPSRVHPLAIKVMAELGIDISKQMSKSIEEFRNKDIDVVVTVCRSTEKVVCPFCSSPIPGARPDIITETLPGTRKYIHQGFDDPSEGDGTEEDKVATFRHTRDNIEKWIRSNFADLKIGEKSTPI